MSDYKKILKELNEKIDEISTDFIFIVKSYLKEKGIKYGEKITTDELCDMFIRDKLLPSYSLDESGIKYWDIDVLYEYMSAFSKKDHRKKIFKEMIVSGKFYTTSDISKMINRSPATIISTLIKRDAFPKPIGKLRGKWVWGKKEVDDWVEKFYISKEKEREETYKKYLTQHEMIRIFNISYEAFLKKKKFLPKSIFTRKFMLVYPYGVVLYPIEEIEKWLKGDKKYNLITHFFTKEKLDNVVEKLKNEIEKRKKS